MKKFWNNLKLGFKEQLRIVGKFDINPKDNYMVKKRKFEDVDIAKDFEKRLREKTIEDVKDYQEEQMMDFDKMSLEELENFRKGKINKEEEEKKSDIYQKIIVQDIK
jgi:hypothetical protein